MDRRERYENPQDALRTALRGWQEGIWTAMPGIVQSYDPATMTCVVQPSIQVVLKTPVDPAVLATSWPNFPNMPLVADCPVFFPSGGGCTLTFPIAPGDECLVVFASRCIDAWWQNGGVQPQALIRMHDLSDGFVFAGVRSVPRVLPSLSADSVQLRTDDGLASVGLNPTTHAVNVVTSGSIAATAGGNLTANATGSIALTAPAITLNGPVTVNGTLTTTGGITGAGIDFQSHHHTGVTTGAGNTGGPV